MITLVGGYPFSGKSTLIADNPEKILGEFERDNVEFLAPYLKSGKAPYDGMVLHLSLGGDGIAEHPEPVLTDLVDQVGAENIRFLFIVVPATELLERTAFDSGRSRRSNKQRHFRRGKRLTPADVIQDYEGWFDSANALNVRSEYIKASRGATTVVDEDTARATLRELVTTTNTQMTYDEVKTFVEDEEYPRYHSVDLPYGLASKGQDISRRFTTIFPRQVKGWSVLDIGCALGGFSYEAERRGATVLASDIRDERLDGAQVFAEILGSEVAFTNTDFLDPSTNPDTTFDLVLVLNVLHHVPNPVEAMGILASLSHGVVVMEFPTSHDPLYDGENKPMKNLVGPDLIENIGLFDEVRMHPSAKEGRVIAVCFVNDKKKYRRGYDQLPPTKSPRKAIPQHEQSLFT